MKQPVWGSAAQLLLIDRVSARMFFDRSRKCSDHCSLRSPTLHPAMQGKSRSEQAQLGKAKPTTSWNSSFWKGEPEEVSISISFPFARFTHKAQSLNFMWVCLVSSMYFTYCVLYIHLGSYHWRHALRLSAEKTNLQNNFFTVLTKT